MNDFAVHQQELPILLFLRGNICVTLYIITMKLR